MISLNKTYVLLITLIVVMFSFSNKVSGKYEKIIYDFQIKFQANMKKLFMILKLNLSLVIKLIF